VLGKLFVLLLYFTLPATVYRELLASFEGSPHTESHYTFPFLLTLKNPPFPNGIISIVLHHLRHQAQWPDRTVVVQARGIIFKMLGGRVHGTLQPCCLYCNPSFAVPSHHTFPGPFILARENQCIGVATYLQTPTPASTLLQQ
jgi:hypothetical protein